MPAAEFDREWDLVPDQAEQVQRLGADPGARSVEDVKALIRERQAG